MSLRAIKNFPDWAESQFAVLCDAQNVIRNKSTQDRAGWDYIVEFDETVKLDVPLDHQRGSTTCRVQIKSKTSGNPRIELKLSNALRFCREPDPCFILLMHCKKDTGLIEYYVREFDAELMTQTLRKAREADRDSIFNTHKIRIPITFRPKDRTSDPIEALRLQSAGSGTDYAVQKAKLNATLGYEKSSVSGTFTLALSQIQPFIDNTAGLPASFEVERVCVSDKRFGIPARTPIFDGKPLSFNFKTSPRLACIRVEGTNGRSAAFEGQFRSFNLPGLPFDRSRATFTSNGISAVIQGHSEMTLNYDMSTTSRRTLAEHYNLLSLNAVLLLGPVSIALDINGKEVLITDEMNCKPIRNNWINWFDEVLTCLNDLAFNSKKPIFSLDDLGFQSDIVTNFVGALSDGDFTITLEFEKLPPQDITIRNVAYFVWLEAGDSTFTAIVRRPCLIQDLEERQLKVVLGDPVILESTTETGPASRHLPALRRRFEALKTRLGDGILELNGGDLLANL